MAFLLSLEGIQRRDLHTGAKLFAALGQPVLMHGARPSWDQVQQAGRGVVLPACQVHDAGEFTWAPVASVLVVPYVLVNPQHPHACEAGGVIRCGLQARLDVGPYGVPRSCQLSGQASDRGSLETQLSDRPADRPGAQTCPGCAHPLVMFQECHRLAGGFSAYPSPYCATGSLPGPRPRARQSPLPPHARDLERSPHNLGTPPAGCTTQYRAPEPQGCEPHSSDGSPLSRRADHTDHNDQATRSSRQGETPPELLDDSGGRSPLIIKDLDLYPQHPTNTHSPILNSEEPDFCRVDKRRQYEHTYKHAYEEHLRLRSGCGTI